ncbi:biotin transporter BioY [Jiangella alkaliphila]|uniref:Biotin transporter n=1 Tax=Jiangella alkaliphila TaxID=419479 RepID=A0A1H2LTT9_9ACTN|nr:BioY family transporter [Jiangella alkaliphila]SDU84407.1 biotin transport system substrate-specific component [Jiangella alkaliphila]
MTGRSRLPAADLARIAAFAALTAVLGLPGSFHLFGNAVPVTLQSMVPLLAGAILGAKRGALSQLLLLALVAAGLPLLAGGRGGLGVFTGPSVGYLAGFVVSAFVVGLIVERSGRRPGMHWVLVATLLGAATTLAIGIPVQSAVTGVPLTETFQLSLAFVPGDAAKAVFAALVASGAQRAYPDAAPAARRERVAGRAGGDDAGTGGDDAGAGRA